MTNNVAGGAKVVIGVYKVQGWNNICDRSAANKTGYGLVPGVKSKKVSKQYLMKKYRFALLPVAIFLCCQKELSAVDKGQQKLNEIEIQGKWQFVSFTDSTGKTISSSNPCWADNTLELKEDNTAVISQGSCIETPAKAKDVAFTWRFLSEDVVDMGGDTVKVTVNNGSQLEFHRISKSFLEYKWKK
jgi:hypothetical protein